MADNKERLEKLLKVSGYCYKENIRRERGRERRRERERDKQTDRQTIRQTEGGRYSKERTTRFLFPIFSGANIVSFHFFRRLLLTFGLIVIIIIIICTIIIIIISSSSTTHSSPLSLPFITALFIFKFNIYHSCLCSCQQFVCFISQRSFPLT